MDTYFNKRTVLHVRLLKAAFVFMMRAVFSGLDSIKVFHSQTDFLKNPKEILSWKTWLVIPHIPWSFSPKFAEMVKIL